MIRGGLLCATCSRKTCRSIGDEKTLIEIECVHCDGEGCEKCDHGYFQITGCPNAVCSGVSRSLDYYDLAKKGNWPVAGGMLDQSASFVRFVQEFESEERKVANERIS